MTNNPPTAAIGTAEKILNAAETLFIDKGFAATSMRAIAALAEVNLAAINYHFATKVGLLSSTIHRRAKLITQLRFEALDRLQQQDDGLTVAKVMATFFTPFTDDLVDHSFNRLMGRLFGEPASFVRPILKKEFGATADRYTEVLTPLLPRLSAAEIRWRFHFIVGSMTHLLNYSEPLGVAASDEPIEEKFSRLHAFAVAGLEN